MLVSRGRIVPLVLKANNESCFALRLAAAPCYRRHLVNSPFNPYGSRSPYGHGGRPRMVFGGGGLTPAIKGIIIACVAVFIIQNIVGNINARWMAETFGLSSYALLARFWIWQPITYLFLHSTQSILHLVFNMLMLWMFGSDLERRWGTQAFLQFYLICGVGAGLTSVVLDTAVNAVWGAPGAGLLSQIPTIGASGAVYGLLAAQAMLFPDRMILLFFFFPMRMRPAVLLMVGLMLYAAWTPGSGINHIAHLGGMVFAWAYLRRVWNVRQLWMEWRWKVRRRKYKVVSDIRDDDRFRYH